jgi:flagellar basal-body rod modification protein FlgD
MTNTIDTATLSQLGLLQQPSQSTGSRDKLGQADFMRLMITQLRNQDPFQPMQSGEFLGQLAQFGTVSGIDDVRSALEALSGSVTASQTLQAASLVDRHVLVPAKEAWLPPSGKVEGAVDVPPGTSSIAVGVYDLGGTLVATLPIDSTSAGQHALEWTGELPDGSQAPSGYYELRAVGTVDGASTALDTLVSGRVESVSVNGSSIGLTVTGLGVVNFADVRGISS